MVPRYEAAVVWDEEKVLVSGGYAGGLLSSTEWFDGTAWSAGPELPYGVDAHCMVRLPGTWDILLIGGTKQWAGSVSDTHVYKNSTQLWTKVSSMSRGRYYHACTGRPSGEIWVGGIWGDDPTVEIYTVETDSWRGGPDLPYASLSPGRLLADGDELFYVGGKASSDIHKLNKAQNGWIFVRMQ